MKEKLTIDQKIQIAKISADIVQTAMETEKQPGALVDEKSRASVLSEDALFQHFYALITEKVTCEPEQN